MSEALSEFSAQNYLEARRHFIRAHEMFPNARTLRGLSIVAFELHRYGETITFGEQALHSSVKPLESEMRGETEQLIARARELVSTVTLQVVPEATLVSVDGDKPRPVTAAPLLLDLGSHELAFQADGYAPQRERITVEGGETRTLRVLLRTSAVEASDVEAMHAASSTEVGALRSARVDATRTGTRWQRPLAGAAIGVGVAAFVVAALFTTKHGEDGDRLRRTNRENDAYPSRIHGWAHSRPQPFIAGALGAVAASSGVAGMLHTSKHGLPWWSWAFTGATAVGLLSWGIADVALGASCGSEHYDRRACSSRQEQRDKGALLMMSTTPLLAFPIKRLIDWTQSDSRSPGPTLAFLPRFSSQQRTVFFDARVDW